MPVRRQVRAGQVQRVRALRLRPARGRGLLLPQQLADQADPTKPTGVSNPPGLGHRDLPSFWDLRAESGTLPDTNLATGCYPTDRCHGRITHDEGLSKDRADINTETGLVTDPTMPRGKIGDNTQRAVNDAINEARRQWAILRFLLVERYGAENGGKMICALTSDSADRSCNDDHKARTEFAPVPSSRVQLASTPIPPSAWTTPGEAATTARSSSSSPATAPRPRSSSSPAPRSSSRAPGPRPPYA